jgi:hypothetical protein
MSQENGPKTGRRDVLKKALFIGLGASALVQPNGAVLGTAFGQEPEKKEEGKKKKGKKKEGDDGKKE